MTTHNTPRPNRLAIAIGFALYGGMASTAAANDRAVTELDKVVVTATRSAESISSISGTVQVIDGEQVQEQVVSGKKFSDILEQLVPGMGPSTQSVNDRTQSIRGRRLLVLIDGISQADNRQISRHLTTIRPENVERIEVVSGASAIYGGGATGGIINIITRKPEDGSVNFASEVGVKVSDNELNAYTLHQSVSGRQGDFDFLLNGTFESRGGLFDADGERISGEPAQGARNDTDTRDALIKLGYDLDSEKRLEATLQYFRDEMDSDYAPDYGTNLSRLRTKDEPVSGAVEGLQLDEQFYTNRDSISLVYTDEDFYGQELTAQTYYRKRHTQGNPYPNEIPRGVIHVNQSISEAEVYGLKLDLSKDFSDKLRVTYGFDYAEDSGEQDAQIYDLMTFRATNGLTLTPAGDLVDNSPDVDARTLGLFLQNSYDLRDDLTLNFGVRYERAKVDIKDYNPLAESWYIPTIEALAAQAGLPVTGVYTTLEGDTKTYSETLFNTGVVYRINDEQEVFANYSEGFEVPDASRLLRNNIAEGSDLVRLGQIYDGATLDDDETAERFFTSLQTDVSEANLDAIKTKSYELGWRGRFDTFQASATAYYNESDQTLRFNANGNYAVDLADEEKKVYGIDASLDYFLNDYWVIGGSYSFVEGRSYDENAGKWLDLSAADVSPEKITAYASYAEDDLQVRLQATSFADYDKGKQANADGEVTSYDIDGYTTVDLLASYSLPVGVVSFGITNLLNEDYETVYSQWARDAYSSVSSHKAEGRTYSLSYRVEY